MKTMDTTEKYLDGFRNWWMAQGRSPRSASVHCSGIRQIDESFFSPVVGHSMFSALDNAIATGAALDWLVPLVDMVNDKIAHTENPTVKTKLQNQRGHLRNFIEYVTQLQLDAVRSSNDKYEFDPEELPDGKLYFERDTIQSLFTLKIALCGDLECDCSGIPPLSVIRQLFKVLTESYSALVKKLGIVDPQGKLPDMKERYLDTMVQGARRVKFHTVKGDFELQQADGILVDIAKPTMWLRVKGRDYLLLTESSAGMVPMEEYTPLTMKIVPTKPLAVVIGQLSTAMVTTRILTDELLAVCPDVLSTDFDPQKLSKSGLDWNKIAPLLPHVLNELTYLLNATTLVAKSMSAK